MTKTWLFAHQAERDCAYQIVQKLAPTQLTQIQWEVMGPGQRSLENWLQKRAFDSPHHVTLIGIAGALDPNLKVGDWLEQTHSRASLYLSPSPVETQAKARELFEQNHRPAVVMESLWSSPETRAHLDKFEWTRSWNEVRGISDHCEGLTLPEIRQRLPQALETAVKKTLTRLEKGSSIST